MVLLADPSPSFLVETHCGAILSQSSKAMDFEGCPKKLFHTFGLHDLVCFLEQASRMLELRGLEKLYQHFLCSQNETVMTIQVSIEIMNQRQKLALHTSAGLRSMFRPCFRCPDQP